MGAHTVRPPQPDPDLIPPDVQEVLVADASVDGLSPLLEGMDPGVKVVLVDPRHSPRRALEPLLEAPRLERLHVLGHGAPGQVQLGRARLSHRWVKQLPLLQWRSSLQAICIWSCNSAAGAVGQRWLQLLADRCDTTVYAAEGLIGATALGGSWQLDAWAEPRRRVPSAGPAPPRTEASSPPPGKRSIPS